MKRIIIALVLIMAFIVPGSSVFADEYVGWDEIRPALLDGDGAEFVVDSTYPAFTGATEFDRVLAAATWVADHMEYEPDPPVPDVARVLRDPGGRHDRLQQPAPGPTLAEVRALCRAAGLRPALAGPDLAAGRPAPRVRPVGARRTPAGDAGGLVPPARNDPLGPGRRIRRSLSPPIFADSRPVWLAFPPSGDIFSRNESGLPPHRGRHGE